MSINEKSPIGRNHPPKEHQFGPDHPGNRRGRPKGSRNIKTIVQEFAQLKHWATINGRRRRLTTVELLLQTLKAKALQGDVPANKEVERLHDRFTPVVTKDGGYLVVPQDQSPEEWIRQAEISQSVRQDAEIPQALSTLHEPIEQAAIDRDVGLFVSDPQMQMAHH